MRSLEPQTDQDVLDLLYLERPPLRARDSVGTVYKTHLQGQAAVRLPPSAVQARPSRRGEGPSISLGRNPSRPHPYRRVPRVPERDPRLAIQRLQERLLHHPSSAAGRKAERTELAPRVAVARLPAVVTVSSPLQLATTGKRPTTCETTTPSGEGMNPVTQVGIVLPRMEYKPKRAGIRLK